MNDADRYWLRNPAHPIPEMGASEYLGVPYDAKFEAWYESDFKNSGYTVPFLKYEGPGNSTNLGPPKTYADYISKLHDLRYAYASYLAKEGKIDKATFDERITYADAEFVKEQSWWPDGVIGKAGITTKMLFEKVVNLFGGEKHQYPGNPESENFETSINEEPSEVYNLNMSTNKPLFTDKNGNPISAQQWQHRIHQVAGNKFRGTARTSEEEKVLLAEQKKEFIKNAHREKYKEIGEKYFDHFKKTQTRQYTLWHDRNEQSTSEREPEQSTSGEATKQAKKRTNEELDEEEPADKQQILNEVSENREEENNTNSENNSKNTEATENMRTQNMDVDNEKSGANVGSITGGTGITNTSGQVYTSKGFERHSNGTMSYSNHFRFRTFGTKPFVEAGLTTATAIEPCKVTVSSVALPTEYLCFYIPKGLYTALKKLPNCRPTKIKVKVTPIGVQVNFTTNSGQTQSGTTSHTAYFAAVVGLNSKIPCDKVTISRDPTNPMVISSVAKHTSNTEWIERIWGVQIPTGSTPVPTTTLTKIVEAALSGNIINPNTYRRIYFPTPPVSSSTQVPIDAGIANSFWALSRLMPKQSVSAHIGTPCINFEYKYNWPSLSSTATKYYTPGLRSDGITVTRRGKRGKQTIVLNSGNNATYVNTNLPDETSTQPYANFTYDAEYQNFCLNNLPGFDAMTFESRSVGSAVPSIDIGLEAIKSNVPEASTEDYINASVDFLVETYIEFESTMEHDFAYEEFDVLCDTDRSPTIGLITNTNVTQTNVIYRKGLPLLQ